MERLAVLDHGEGFEGGSVFAHDLRSTGVLFRSEPAADGPTTGRCLIVVTPDAQRTMNTYLGSSEFMGPEHVDVELIASARVTFLEGYLFDRPEAKEAYWKASRVASLVSPDRVPGYH